MVARINTSKSIAKALNYNEQKVRNGKAECIYASGFIKDNNELNFYNKLHHFERRISLNERVSCNTIHVSLNFDSSEKIDTEKLTSIAKKYMEILGFCDQPYLVYKHNDAGHPHIHIVSTNIQKDGSVIYLHNIGKNQSEKARKEIEIEYGLVKAENSKQTNWLNLGSVNAKRIIYGKSETKREITNVLMRVISQYKFTSLPGLNAVLKLYNVVADRGEIESRLYRNNGLIFRILDEKGNKVGTPIKASSIYMKPTLSFLEKKFVENRNLSKTLKKKFQTNIDWVISKKPRDINQIKVLLEKENIGMVIWQNRERIIYGLTFIDHKTKCVFNGSELGKDYSAQAIIERCKPENILQEKEAIQLEKRIVQPERNESVISDFIKNGLNKALETLSEPISSSNYIPYQLKKNRKKKKRKRLSI